MKRLIRPSGTELKRRALHRADRAIRSRSARRARDFIEPLLLEDGNEAELVDHLQQADRYRPGAIACSPEPLLALLRQLRGIGVSIHLCRPRKHNCLAEWDPRSMAIRVSPAVARGGTRDFERALCHEAVHVAQSCRGGRLASQPVALGLVIRNPSRAAQATSHLIYSRLTPSERRVEEEAYDNQEDIENVKSFLADYCCGSWRENCF